jgi:hypothetical protein
MGSALIRDDGYDLAKILACAAMLMNHCTFHVPELWVPGYMIARFVMPVFAFILVSRLMVNPASRGPRLQRNLLLWGIPSQALYMYFNRADPFSTNMLWDLWVGVALIRINQAHGLNSRWKLIVPAVLAAVFLNPWLQYTAFLPVGMLLSSALVRKREGLALVVLLVFALLANRCCERPVLDNLLIVPMALLAVPVLWLSRKLSAVTPRLSKEFFYFFYPFTYVAAIMVDVAMKR